jgi:hypothetical protein
MRGFGHEIRSQMTSPAKSIFPPAASSYKDNCRDHRHRRKLIVPAGSQTTGERQMANVDKNAPVPEGKTKYYTTKQQPANKEGFVGYHTEWVAWHKEVPYETPKKP